MNRVKYLNTSEVKFGLYKKSAIHRIEKITHFMLIVIGNEKLDVYFCPGHTPGHIIFFNSNSKLAIVGDVLFNGSIGRTDLPGGNFELLIESVKNKLWPLGNDIEFIPGHGPVSTFSVERASNPFVSDNVLGLS